MAHVFKFDPRGPRSQNQKHLRSQLPEHLTAEKKRALQEIAPFVTVTSLYADPYTHDHREIMLEGYIVDVGTRNNFIFICDHTQSEYARCFDTGGFWGYIKALITGQIQINYAAIPPTIAITPVAGSKMAWLGKKVVVHGVYHADKHAIYATNCTEYSF